jgi:hypothetical protein
LPLRYLGNVLRIQSGRVDDLLFKFVGVIELSRLGRAGEQKKCSINLRFRQRFFKITLCTPYSLESNFSCESLRLSVSLISQDLIDRLTLLRAVLNVVLLLLRRTRSILRRSNNQPSQNRLCLGISSTRNRFAKSHRPLS